MPNVQDQEDLTPEARRREVAKLLARAVIRRVTKAKATGQPLVPGRHSDTDRSRLSTPVK